MNFRKQIIDKISGNNNGCPLFVPRLDIWYNANKIANTLPAEFSDLSLMAVSQKLGVGFHSVIPTFLSSDNIEDIHHRGLGFYNHPSFPYVVDFSEIDFKAEIINGELKVTYYSKLGTITAGINYSQDFLMSGLSIPDITEHAIKEHSDYLKLADILSRVKIVPTPENYTTHYNAIGKHGVAVAFLSLAAGPMQHIMRDLRPFEQFIFDLYDAAEMMNELVKSLTVIYQQMIESVLLTQAEIVLFGANYDTAITCPPFFAEHIKPWLIYCADKMHAAGKYLLTHTDGENSGLLELYTASKIDIADSVCPAPMTNIKLKDYRDAFQDEISIWGGIPSNIMLKAVCNDNDFKIHIDKLLEASQPFNKLIFSIADTTPPATAIDRLLYLCEKMAKGTNS